MATTLPRATRFRRPPSPSHICMTLVLATEEAPQPGPSNRMGTASSRCFLRPAIPATPVAPPTPKDSLAPTLSRTRHLAPSSTSGPHCPTAAAPSTSHHNGSPKDLSRSSCSISSSVPDSGCRTLLDWLRHIPLPSYIVIFVIVLARRSWVADGSWFCFSCRRSRCRRRVRLSLYTLHCVPQC